MFVIEIDNTNFVVTLVYFNSCSHANHVKTFDVGLNLSGLSVVYVKKICIGIGSIELYLKG